MTKYIVTIDPGTVTAGICIWDHRGWYGSIKACKLTDPPVLAKSITLPKVKKKLNYQDQSRRLFGIVETTLRKYLYDTTDFHIEEMTIIPGRMDAAKDIMGVTFFCGMLAEWAHGALDINVEMVRVIDWKGNMSKAMTAARIAQRFSNSGLDAENYLTPKKKPGHDWDACGIGLWGMGLFGDKKS